jgi:NitT/TauT family transport system substrate-binding protein
MTMKRILLACILVLAFGTAMGQTRVTVGYLHTLAVDGHLWIAQEHGLFAEQGIEIEPVPFNSGIPLAQALAGGSVDVAVMGAVISNFPSRGVGKIFLVNNVEAGTAMIFVHEDSGIETVADLVGREISTTRGTTAHVLLATALQANGLSPEAAEVVNMDMASAVTAFISGAVPAVSTWWPFNAQIQAQVPNARIVTQASDYYPEAAIMGGWVANTNFYESNREVLVGIATAWLGANDILENDTAAALAYLQEEQYPNLTLADLESGFELLLTFENDEWVDLYQEGSVEQWIGQVQQVFVDIGALDSFVDVSEFFDASVFLEAYESTR